MSDNLNDFEKRFTSSWFSSGWVEVLPVQKTEAVNFPVSEHHRKNLQDLQHELEDLQSDVENISFKQLRMSNLAKLYGEQ